MTAIIEFSKRHRLTIREASNYLNRFKGIAFLTEFYDVEHTLSFNDCEEGLTVVCQKMEGQSYVILIPLEAAINMLKKL